jgi:hypothetical protein
MLKNWFAMMMCCVFLVGTQSVLAQDKDDSSSVEEELQKVADLGPGVHNIVKDKKGQIVSCMVVGQVRITTALGKAKGIELARNKANLACSAEFVKWLKEEVSVLQTNDEETVILMEGEEGAEDKLNESAKSVEKSSTKMESISKGLVRGLQVIHNKTDGDGKSYTIIKGWKADSAKALKKVSKDLADDESDESDKGKKTKDGEGKSKDGDSKKPKGQQIDKDIESSSNTSSDAADFLPKKKKAKN